MVRRRANRLARPGKPLKPVKNVKVKKAETIRGIGTGGGAAPAGADAGGSQKTGPNRSPT